MLLIQILKTRNILLGSKPYRIIKNSLSIQIFSFVVQGYICKQGKALFWYEFVTKCVFTGAKSESEKNVLGCESKSLFC
jgi:hypothetical protein